MIKDAIGILDMGIESFNILSTLSQEFKYERFVYINDLKNYPYEGKKEEDILAYVKANVEVLLKEGIKLLIVSSDTIIEYCSDYLSSLKIPTLQLVSTLIDYVNQNYEQKNIVLLAKNAIIEANLYQKNFKYNHLYNIACDDLENIINSKLIKTSKSFSKTKETFKSVIKRDVNIVVTSSPYLLNLKTEILEYLKIDEITDLGEIFAQKIREQKLPLYDKGKGKITIISNIEKKEFKIRTYWSKLKYQYLYLNKEEQKRKVYGVR